MTVTGTFSDPASDVPGESFTGIALWSDSVSTPVVIDGNLGTFSTSRSFPDDHPASGTASDTFTVEITISDGLASDTETLDSTGRLDPSFDGEARS